VLLLPQLGSPQLLPSYATACTIRQQCSKAFCCAASRSRSCKHSCCCWRAQAGLSAAQSALAAAPGDPQLQAELRYAAAAAQLWGAVKEAGDPAWMPGLERYAQQLEVKGGGLTGWLAGNCAVQMACCSSQEVRQEDYCWVAETL
jgi:hypothetical protein